MATIFREERRDTSTLAERLRKLEGKVKHIDRDEETLERTKTFKFPFKWRRQFNKSKKVPSEMVLVLFLNKKNQIEPPKFMPIFEGNMIVWKHKPYEFDPRAVFTVKGMKGNPQAYIIKEIDRRPVSNMNLDEIRARGDSTESDEFLIKAALKAQIAQTKKNINTAVLVILGLIVVGAVIYFLTK